MTSSAFRETKRTKNTDGSNTAKATVPICSNTIQQQQKQRQSRSRSPVKASRYYNATTATISPVRHRYLPKTISVGTTATATSSRSIYSSYSQESLCPVTNVYANINQDYYIFPNKIIGRGHYGIVRECIHRSTRQALAVKSVEKSKIGRLDHLQREVYLLANLKHDGVIKMVDCYEDAEYVHIITKKYTGGELFDKIVDNISPNGCLSERKAGSIIASLLEAVAYLHENGVVHRDIKPENVLFESTKDDAAVKLIDFGLARRHGKGEVPMINPVGTAYYMSPEIFKGRYDRACDIWSIGIVTYVILCGYPPFNGSSDKEVQGMTQNGRLQFAGNAWLTKSDDAVDFIKCLLERDPRKRLTAKEALIHPWIRKMMEF